MSLHCLFPLSLPVGLSYVLIKKGENLFFYFVDTALGLFLCPSCLCREKFGMKTSRWAFDRWKWVVILSVVYLLTLSICCSVFLFASHFILTFISVFWICDDFVTIPLCLTVLFHFTISLFLDFMHSNFYQYFKNWYHSNCFHLIAHLLKTYLSSPLKHTIPFAICTCSMTKYCLLLLLPQTLTFLLEHLKFNGILSLIFVNLL